MPAGQSPLFVSGSMPRNWLTSRYRSSAAGCENSKIRRSAMAGCPNLPRAGGVRSRKGSAAAAPRGSAPIGTVPSGGERSGDEAARELGRRGARSAPGHRAGLQAAGDARDVVELPSGDRHDQLVSLVVGQRQPKSVQAEEGDGRREGEPLVAIDKRAVAGDRV